MLALTVALYVAAFIYFYPLTLRLSMRGGQVELGWLPRLCGGYARPFCLSGQRPAGNSRGKAAAKGRFSMKKLFADRPLLRRLLSHIVVDKLECSVGVGAADPFASSMLAGLLMAALGSVGGVVSTLVKSFPAQPWFAVAALEQGGLEYKLECIFHLRAGDIIGEMARFYWQKFMRRRKHVQRA